MDDFFARSKIINGYAPQVAMDVSTDVLTYGLPRSPWEATSPRKKGGSEPMYSTRTDRDYIRATPSVSLRPAQRDHRITCYDQATKSRRRVGQ